MIKTNIRLMTTEDHAVPAAVGRLYPFGRSKKYSLCNSTLGYGLDAWINPDTGEVEGHILIMSSWYPSPDNKLIKACKTWGEVCKWAEEHIDEIEAEVREAEEKFKKDQ